MLVLDQHTRQYVFKIQDCHNKLNEYGRLALQTKRPPYRSLHHSAINQSQASIKRDKVEGEETLSQLLLTNHPRVQKKQKNPELQESINKLKRIGLSSPKELKCIRYEADIRMPTVHNDYHTRASNQGYSRSKTGGIFPK